MIRKLAMFGLSLLLVSGTVSAQVAIPASSFSSDMRKLWEDHVSWTRLYLVSAAADAPDKDATAKRLLQNQEDIGNAIKPFYGAAAGERLSVLLRDHILIATELIDAAKAGAAAKKEDATRRWRANADEIALFLSAANPNYWPANQLRAMMREHLEMTNDEVAARLNRSWMLDIAAYEKVHEQILKMADMLSAGIVAQFPDRFAADAVPVSVMEARPGGVYVRQPYYNYYQDGPRWYYGGYSQRESCGLRYPHLRTPLW